MIVKVERTENPQAVEQEQECKTILFNYQFSMNNDQGVLS
jgi:hypothetical protein